jgi:hypothetical protein
VKRFLRILLLAVVVGAAAQTVGMSMVDPGGDPPPTCSPADPFCPKRA